MTSPNGLPIVCCTRPRGEYANPFRVGRSYIMGDPDPRYRGSIQMMYCEAFVPDRRATLIETPAQAIEWFVRLEKKRNRDLSPLVGCNLACWCKLCDAHRETGKPLDVECPDCAPCHCDPLGVMVLGLLASGCGRGAE